MSSFISLSLSRGLILSLIIISFCANNIQAQPNEGRFIEGSIGFGLTSPNEEEIDVLGRGVFIQGEYVIALKSWFGLRPYAGFVYTNTRENSTVDALRGYKANTTALLVGGKIRLAAPIPYVAPYLEVGYGASIGRFETETRRFDIDKTGIVGHIPFTIGLAIGRDHEVEIEFTYFYQDSVEQFTGAVAIGLSFPLNKTKAEN